VAVLRDVVESDLDAFFEHQREPEANEMAVFPARDREAFYAHWRRILADESTIQKTIVEGNQVGRRCIGYWVGSEFWGKGVATRAVREFASGTSERPLYAWVASTNVGSIRVLEKSGFVQVGAHKNDVEELLFELA
jgi:RimJ/RimL family protein N-acetyltransferase